MGKVKEYYTQKGDQIVGFFYKNGVRRPIISKSDKEAVNGEHEFRGTMKDTRDMDFESVEERYQYEVVDREERQGARKRIEEEIRRKNSIKFIQSKIADIEKHLSQVLDASTRKESESELRKWKKKLERLKAEK